MEGLILLIIICSLFCVGFNYSTSYVPVYEHVAGQLPKEQIPDKTELLWFIKYYGNKFLPVYIQKPLYGCLMCMSSIWGSIFYWGYVLNSPGRINGLTIIIWVVVVMAVCGLNRIVKQASQI